MKGRRPILACVLAALVCGGAASGAPRADDDPWEGFNRRVFAFNQAADRAVIKPVARGYVRMLPEAVRDGLRNVVQNIDEPAVFVNNLLQGKFRRAAITADRFALNSVFGLAGWFDLAARGGRKRQVGDLGQTFHAWGLPEGPYLVLPLAGPSSPRDAVGLGLQVYLDPFRYVSDNNNFNLLESNAPGIVRGIDLRSRNIESLEAVEADSIDFYASLRSLFRQNRVAELRGDASPAAPVRTDLYDDPGDAPSRAAAH
jgi:phospholipid-binding lipoprotein MlaA